MLAVRRGRQVIMSSSHKWRPRPPTLFLSLVFSLTKPDVSTITTVSKLVLQTLALVSNLNPPLLSLNNIRSSDVAFHLLLWLYGKDISPPPPVSHGPYGGVDRSEKEHRDSVALKFFFFFFTRHDFYSRKKKFYKWLFPFFFFFSFFTGTEIIVSRVMTNAEMSRGEKNDILPLFKCGRALSRRHRWCIQTG